MKPIARVVGYHAGRCVIEPTNPADVLPTGMALFDATPEVKQEPVAFLSLDCIGERYLCFSKPVDNDPVTPLYTFPPSAQAEIAKRDERIESLTSAGAEYQRQCFEQAKQIEELEFSWAGCSQQLKDACDDLNRAQEHSRMQALSIADHVDVRGEQAAEISRLKGVIAKCACSLHTITKRANYLDVLDIAREANQALAAIKEEGL